MNMLNFRYQLLFIWRLLDPIYYAFTRLNYIEDQQKKRQIFRVRLTKYKGKEVVLADGTVISKNDMLVKIHLHNIRLLKEMIDIKSDLKKARVIYQHVEHSLPCLADYIRKHPHYTEIKGIIGITLLAKGVHRLGFESVSISNKWYERFKMLIAWPIYTLSVQKLSLQAFKKQRPKYLFMSKNQLLEKHAK